MSCRALVQHVEELAPMLQSFQSDNNLAAVAASMLSGMFLTGKPAPAYQPEMVRFYPAFQCLQIQWAASWSASLPVSCHAVSVHDNALHRFH